MTFDQVRRAVEAEARRRAEAAAPAEAASGPIPFARFAALSGAELVGACYVELLGRNPDPQGLGHYVALLERGVDKAWVVGSLAYSAEGRRHGARVPGLLPRFALAALRRVF